MAVPKKRKSKAQTRMGRSHHGVELIRLVKDKKTGELRPPHIKASK